VLLARFPKRHSFVLRENCKQALRRAKANKGGPGIDARMVHDLAEYLRGPDIDFGRWSGNSRNGEPRDIESSASAASMRRKPRKRRGAPVDRGTWPTPQR